METFKIVVDVLSSIAALVAIVTVLISWAKDRRNAIEISRLIISPKGTKLRAFVDIKNIKAYPVSISYLCCYRQHTYQIQREVGGRPTINPSFNVADRLFAQSKSVDLLEFGQTIIECIFDQIHYTEDRLIFVVHSTHGIFHTKPKSVIVFHEEISVAPEGSIVVRDSVITGRLQYLKGYCLFIFESVRRRGGL